MKIKLFFDSVGEFVAFVLYASLIDFNNQCQKEQTELKIPYYFLESVFEIQVGNTIYFVEEAQSYQDAEYIIFNYMLNDAQIKNENIFIGTRGNNDEMTPGIQATREIIQKLPVSFLLRVGWRTDYKEFMFRKSAINI